MKSLKKRNKLKRTVIALLAGFMTIGAIPFTVAAEEVNYKEHTLSIVNISGENFTIEEIKQYADEFDITTEEIINLEENLKNALSALGETNNLKRNGTKIQVSENLFLTSSLREENNGNSLARLGVNRTFTAELELENAIGRTVVTLRSHGVFNYSNGRVSAIDGFTSHIGGLFGRWTTRNEAMSQTAGTTAWVRNGFSGEYNIGIDPISVTLRSFQFNNTLTANASTTTATSSWR